MVFVLVGALIMFLAGLFFWVFVEVWCGCWYGCAHYLVVYIYPPQIRCVRQLIKPNVVYKDTTGVTNHMIHCVGRT